MGSSEVLGAQLWFVFKIDPLGSEGHPKYHFQLHGKYPDSYLHELRLRCSLLTRSQERERNAIPSPFVSSRLTERSR